MQPARATDVRKAVQLGVAVDAQGSCSMTLEGIRADLMREEDCIVFHLYSRTHYKRNNAVYDAQHIPMQSQENGREVSLLESVLMKTEQMNASIDQFRRIPDHPFFPEEDDRWHGLSFPDLPASAMLTNVNREIYRHYIEAVLPQLTDEGDDSEYAASALADVQCLLALSRRVHLGKYVAEAKFRAEPEKYKSLIYSQDGEGILAALTDGEVEERVIERVRIKAERYDHSRRYPNFISELYRYWIIPLTKRVEVDVLLSRFPKEKH